MTTSTSVLTIMHVSNIAYMDLGIDLISDRYTETGRYISMRVSDEYIDTSPQWGH